MMLEGSCYCTSVRFRLASRTPYPYMRCYCSICRKTGGGGGYAINIMGQADTLEVTDEQGRLAFHQARVEDKGHPGRMVTSPGKRYFCTACGSALWVADPRWPEWVYPFASAIDTPLPVPPETVHIMLDFKAPWVAVAEGAGQHRFDRYPDEAIADWHKRWGLLEKG